MHREREREREREYYKEKLYLYRYVHIVNFIDIQKKEAQLPRFIQYGKTICLYASMPMRMEVILNNKSKNKSSPPTVPLFNIMGKKRKETKMNARGCNEL